jgi:hypothetical protein
MSGYNRVTCTPIIIAVLFAIAKLWKHPTYHKTNEWIFSTEKYSSIKKNEIMSFTIKQMIMAIIILSEVSQIWKDKGQIFSLI